MEIAVGCLKVIIYVPIQCPKHAWSLSIKPIQGSPYCQCVITGDESIYHSYMALWAKRTPAVTAEYPYERFSCLVNSIRTRGYQPDEKYPLRVYRNTNCLEDGHHRAAIVYALCEPGYKLHVEILDQDVPRDLDQCFNPCQL